MINDQKNPIVAYFSMEIGLENNIKTYSGGLGVLAGDILKSAAVSNFPMIGMTLLNDQGYFKQTVTKSGKQKFEPDDKYDFSKLERRPEKIEILIGDDKVLVGVWQYLMTGHNGFIVPVYFLDTNLRDNKNVYKNLTGELYGGDDEYRLRQEIILGRGGVKMLKALGYDNIKKFHLNEGHGALATIELFLNSELKTDEAKIKEVRSRCVFTTHTPIPKAHDIFSIEYLLKYQRDFPAYLTALYDKDRNVHFTSLGLYFSGYSNAVSRLHQTTCQKMYPNYKINFVTNGVNSEFWSAPEFGELYNKYIPAWRNDGTSLVKAKIIPREEIWSAHQAAKKRLAQYINSHLLEQIDENIFTIGFARRFATYKQPKYLFQDIEKLLAINENIGKMQIIYAGKAHPRDVAGQEMIKFIHDLKKKLKGKIKIIFLSDYDLDKAKLLVAGVDLWLNTPKIYQEASGTSGMKAAHNGVPQLSTLDGWWPEGYLKNKTGWTLIESNNSQSNLYDILEKEIIPCYYNQPDKWQVMMRDVISFNAARFNSDRVLKQYIKEAY